MCDRLCRLAVTCLSFWAISLCVSLVREWHGNPVRTYLWRWCTLGGVRPGKQWRYDAGANHHLRVRVGERDTGAVNCDKGSKNENNCFAVCISSHHSTSRHCKLKYSALVSSLPVSIFPSFNIATLQAELLCLCIVATRVFIAVGPRVGLLPRRVGGAASYSCTQNMSLCYITKRSCCAKRSRE